ncbi:MAG: PIN domain-containing protein [Thermoplasmatota archaeon]
MPPAAQGAKRAVAVDAAYLLDLLAGEADAVDAARDLDRRGLEVVLPAPALYEVLAATQYAHGDQAARELADALQAHRVLPVDAHGALLAARLRARLLSRGHRITHAASLAAGVAQATGHRLLTRHEALLAAPETAAGLDIETYGPRRSLPSRVP